MSIVEECNLTDYQVKTRLGESANFKQKKLFEVRAIYIKESGKWLLYSGSIEEANENSERILDEYSENVFLATLLEFDDVENILSLLEADGIQVDERYPAMQIVKPSRWRETLIPSEFSNNKIPKRHYRQNLKSTNYSDNALIAYNLPYFSSFVERAKEFIPSENGQLGCLHLLFQDSRARFHLAESQVSVSNNIDVSVVGEIKSDSGTKKIGHENGTVKKIDIASASNVELWLVDDKNMIFDYISSSCYPFNFVCNKNVTAEDYIKNKIEHGETIGCEFKKFIELNGGDTKAIEIEKTVCAFSNTNGGDLIIGVSDEGEILGVDQAVRKKYNSSLKEAISNYVKDINKRLLESLTVNDCFRVSQIALCGRSLVVVNVKKSSSWNLLQASHIPYARKGATNYNATNLVALEIEYNKRNITELY